MNTTNALEAIRRIESQADEIITDANKKAESSKRKALEEGERIKKQLIDDAQKKASEYQKKKEREIERESTDILTKAKTETSGLSAKVSSRIPGAVDAVVRIVIGE